MSDKQDAKDLQEVKDALKKALETGDNAAIQQGIEALSEILGIDRDGDSFTVGDISGSTGVAVGKYITMVINQHQDKLAPEIVAQLMAL